MRRKITAAIACALIGVAALSGCSSKANVVSKNISTAADNFQVDRQIVFYDIWTGQTILEVDGLCSIDNTASSGQVAVTCETAPGKYTKDYLGKSTNVTWFEHQTTPARVSNAHYRIIWRPSTVVPQINVQ